jgi:hypothetical protein
VCRGIELKAREVNSILLMSILLWYVELPFGEMLPIAKMFSQSKKEL